MSTVDNRVVSLTFDNASFSSRVNDTLGLLDRLKQSLNFSKSKESLSELQGASSKFNMNGMSSAIEGISAKFVALAAVGIPVLSSITNKAVDAGISIVKSLSFDPVNQGFSEYETNMNSIQTILANTKSKGSSLDDVNAALDKLNTYSDQTIYNFSEMAKNIGTFTAAGVDLDTSVMSIKGIANLAAMSGSSSEQASTAMYQLSQAIAAGSLKLMDWNSVVNAGMGGEAFKTALFETAKAMGTLKDVPMDQTFTQWEAAGNNFRESLQNGWITADVLTTTLGGMSGDMDAAALSAAGFSDAQVVAMQDLASTAVAAATEVKTATQLFDVIKESIGSGWATTFRTIFGNFAEAKQIFTGLNNYIGGFITRAADARNNLLAGWKFIGGRDSLIQGFMYSLTAIQSALAPIKDAFRAVFPPATAVTLANLTNSFRDFAQKLILSADTAAKVKSVFVGIFSIFKIGVEIVKGIFSVFFNLGKVIFSIISPIGSAGAGVGNFIEKIKNLLVEGGGIAAFFGAINSAIQKFGDFVVNIKDKIAGLFGGDKGIPGGEQTASVFSTITDKLSGLSTVGQKAKDIFTSIGDTFKSAFNKIKDALSSVWDAISGFASDFASKIGDVFTSDAFGPAVDAVQVGLLGGIVGILGAFFKKGLKLDFGQFDVLESISDIFDELGGTLKAFQTSIKADALMRIATAIAVLTASVLVLSFIEPQKLAASLGALAAGFAQLVAAMAVMAKIETNPAKMLALAGSLIVLGVAAAVFAVAVRLLSSMSWGELAKGLLGLLGALQLMSMAAAFFAKNSGSFISAGLSLIVLSVALWAFSKVIQTFADMDLGDLVHGLLGVGAALAVLVVSMNLINGSEITKIGIGFVLLAYGLKGLKEVVATFAEMSWTEMLKGFVGMTVALHVIIAALQSMPKNTMGMALGLLVAAGAILVLGKAVTDIGSLDFATLLKGLIGMGLALIMVVFAVNAMQGAALGVPALLLVSAAMLILGKTLEIIGNLSLGQIITGLVGIAGVLLILAGAAALFTVFPPLLLALEGLGVALILVGAGFMLFGAGAYLTAKALVELGNAGKKSINTLIEILNTIIAAIPGFVQAFAEGVLEFFQVMLDAAPKLIDGFQVILDKLLDMIIELMPKIGEAFASLIDMLVLVINEKSPMLIEAGFALLMNFLQGLRDNISQITAIVMTILTIFLQTIADNLGVVMQAASNIMAEFIRGLGAHALDLVQAGVDALTSFLSGISSIIDQVITSATEVINSFIRRVADMALDISAAGSEALVNFLNGIATNIGKVVTTAFNLITAFIRFIGDNAGRVVTAGKDTALKFLDGLADNAIDFTNKAGAMIVKFLRGLEEAVNKYAPQIREAAKDLGIAIIDGITGGLMSKVGGLLNKAKDVAGDVMDVMAGPLGWIINSPSKAFYRLAQWIPAGIVKALDEDNTAVNAAQDLAQTTLSGFNDMLSRMSKDLTMSDEFNPVITPVLDLTGVSKDAKSLSGMLSASQFSPSLSYSKAALISKTTDVASKATQEVQPYQGPAEVKFEQNNFSPKALTANDIYRNTRNQITMAKEELSIP